MNINAVTHLPLQTEDITQQLSRFLAQRGITNFALAMETEDGAAAYHQCDPDVRLILVGAIEVAKAQIIADALEE